MRGLVLALVLVAGLACATGEDVPVEEGPVLAPDTDTDAVEAPDDDDEARGGKRPARDRHKAGKRKAKGGGGEEPEPEPAPSPAPAPRPTEVACHAKGVYTVCADPAKPASCKDEEAEADGPGETRSVAEAMAVEACEAHMATLMSFAGSGKAEAKVKKPCAVTTCTP